SAQLRTASFYHADVAYADFSKTLTIDLDSIKRARNWILARYSDSVTARLGLDANHAQLLRRRQLHMNTSGNVKLDGASLARFDLSDIPGLRGADFSRADLRSTYFGNVEMVGLVADSAILDSATLIHANMRGASLKQALARGARLDSAILTD